jgi:hypothetical protein
VTLSLAACSFDLEPLIRSFHNSAFVEDIDVVKVGEVVDVGEVVVDDHDMSSSFHSRALGKAFAFERIASQMRTSLARLGWCL